MLSNSVLKGVIGGFALFSMFFGSGNLVFPLLIGSSSSGVMSSMIGIFVSAILIPLLGLIGKLIRPGSSQEYFLGTGKIVNNLLMFIIVMLIGPFGVAPRCILVSYGSFSSFCSINLWVFSLIYTAISVMMIIKKGAIVNIIGKYMTPVLLISVFFIIISGLMSISDIPFSTFDSESFWSALSTGYQTMDLIAAIFFAFTIQDYFNPAQNKAWLFQTLIAFMVASILLMIVYGGFVAISFGLKENIQHIAPEMMLIEVSKILFGNYAAPFLALVVNLACITTFVALIDIFADFTCDKVNKINCDKCCLDNNKEKQVEHGSKMSQNCSKICLFFKQREFHILLSGCLSFILSLVGFTTIVHYLAQAMSIMYPCVIAYTIGVILDYLLKKKNIVLNTSGVLFYVALFILIFYYMIV